MTHHDAKRIATEAGFKPFDTNAPDLMIASYHARGAWLAMKQIGSRWCAHISNNRERDIATAWVEDEVALRAVLTREMEKGSER